LKKRLILCAGLLLAGCSSFNGGAVTKPKVVNDTDGSSFMRMASSAAERHAQLPSGSRIYYGSTLQVRDDSSAASFPGDATYQRDQRGVVVTYAGRTHIFSGSATVTRQQSAEYYVLPGRAVPQSVKRLRYETVGAR
jgi:hypothetical protein